MCGILGIYYFDSERPIDKALLERMSRTLIHRGPDDEGFYISSGIGLGHRRLSIIDLESGKQPMGNEDGSVQVVFNGEIYNFLELRPQLEAKGHVFRTRSDTETLIHGYEEWGIALLQRINGMFAFCIWDQNKRRIFLARDRVGKKPLYFSLNKERLLFASELKALLCDLTLNHDIDLTALDDYLSFLYIPSPKTIFRNASKLPPAHYLMIDDGQVKMGAYWELVFEPKVKEEEVLGFELDQKLSEATRKRLISDVPLGAFLSGGIDSSAVVAHMVPWMDGRPLITASIGFDEARYNELAYARQVANQYATQHNEFVAQPRALDVIEKIVWHLDEPFGDSSVLPTYYVSKLAKEVVTVALSGDGGDENYAGYIRRYWLNRFEDRIRNGLPSLLRRSMLGPLGRTYPKWDFLPAPLRLKFMLTNLSCPHEEAYFRDMSMFLPESKQKLYSFELKKELVDYTPNTYLSSHFERARFWDTLSRIQYVDIKTYLTEDILVKVDRMSMAHSLEVRSPLLDYELMEFAATIPSELKLKGSTSKYILKKSLKDRLPSNILNRGKQGFSIPLAEWLRGELREYVEEVLFSQRSRQRGYFNEKSIEKIWKRHLHGITDYSAHIWTLLMLELWHQVFFDHRSSFSIT
jgi:asparagine synthase (glutamine-hydrolysing)